MSRIPLPSKKILKLSSGKCYTVTIIITRCYDILLNSAFNV